MERWKRIEEIFHTAIAQSPTQRVNYLNQACAEDLTLRKELDILRGKIYGETIVKNKELATNNTARSNIARNNIDIDIDGNRLWII